MEPARTIIAKFGGDTALAKLLGIHRTRVAFWKQPRPRGSGGMIPYRHIQTLVRLGRERGIPLTGADFAPHLDEDAA